MATARKLPSGSWRCLVYDYTDADGKRRYKSFTSDDPTARGKREAEYQAAEYAMSKQHLKKVTDMTLREAITKYINASDGVLSPTTISGYKIIQKSGFRAIMDMPLNKITNDILKDAVNEESKRKSDSRRCKGKTISPKTVANEYGLITAVLNEYTNIDTTVKLPAKENKIKELLPPEIIFNAVKDTDIELPVLLAMWLSFSLSEIKGLTQDSVRDGYITIKQVCVHVEGKDIRKNQAKQFTRNRKHRIPEYIQALIDKIDTEYLVPMSGKMVNYRFSKILNDNDLPHMTFHDLRHVNASVMALLQVPDKYAQERGGWKTDNVMKKVYTHTFSRERQLVDDKIDDFFSTITGATMEIDQKKYNAWLLLYDKENNKQSIEEFQSFMQHKMQHK